MQSISSSSLDFGSVSACSDEIHLVRSRFLSTTPSSEQIGADASSNDGGRKSSSFRRRAIPVVLLSITGGVALSALNDLAIFHGCSRY